MTREQGVEFDPVAFMVALHREFNVVNVLQRTKLVARMTKEYPLTAQNVLVAMLYPVAMDLRIYLLITGLLGFAKPYLPSNSPLAKDGALLSEWLRVMGPEAADTIADCDAGMDRAFNALTPELILGGRDSLEVTRRALVLSPHARLDANLFLAKARRLHVDTPLLRAFRAVVEDSDSWDGTIEGEGRVYFLLTVDSQDRDTSRLFSIPLEGRPRAVCAFTSKKTMAIFASNFISRYLAVGETFGGRALQVQHLALLDSLVRKEIGQAITLIVEGSDAFDDLVRAVDHKMSGASEEDRQADVQQRAAEALTDRYKLYAGQVEDPASLQQFTQILRLLEDL